MGPTTTVGETNQPPVAVDDAYTTPLNSTLVVPAPGVLANDSDPNGDPLTAGMPTNPSNGTLNLSADGGFTYTPTSGFTGVDTFTYMAHDPFGGMTTATVTSPLRVPRPPPPPCPRRPRPRRRRPRRRRRRPRPRCRRRPPACRSTTQR